MILRNQIQTYKPHSKQIEAHRSNKKYVLFGGAMGGGKSAWLINHVNKAMVKYPGNRGFIARRQFSDFKISTYLVIREFLKDLIQLRLVKENKSEKRFTYWNGSELYYGQVDAAKEGKPNRLFSAEFGIIAIDEAWEISHEQFKKAGTRLRHTLPDEAEKYHKLNKKGKKCPFYQMILSTNPAQNWIKDVFILAPTKSFDFIQSLPNENPYNPDGYEDEMRELFRGDEKFIKAFLEGSWDAVMDPDQLLSMDQVNSCTFQGDVTPLVRHYDNRIISIDPAYMGNDKTVIYLWINECPVKRIELSKKDPADIYGHLMLLEPEISMGDPSNVLYVVDDTGGYGSGVVSMLKKTNRNVIPVNFASSAKDKDHYENKRAEIYWEMRQVVVDQDCAIPDKYRKLKGQLAAMKYKRTGKYKFIMESKDDYIDRMGESPDDADSFTLGIHGNLLLNRGDVVLQKVWDSEIKPEWLKSRQNNQNEACLGVDEEIIV